MKIVFFGAFIIDSLNLIRETLELSYASQPQHVFKDVPMCDVIWYLFNVDHKGMIAFLKFCTATIAWGVSGLMLH